jgi:hypothetical protein
MDHVGPAADREPHECDQQADHADGHQHHTNGLDIDPGDLSVTANFRIAPVAIKTRPTPILITHILDWTRR